MIHRGPDDAGIHIESDAGIVLGHQRLAILDLSPSGHQPMISANGRYAIVFNGEIYNHLELRRQLSAQGAQPAWRGHSDTETLLACFAAWGFETTLRACVGMFALALWDRMERRLWLARDRLGEKPLYYGRIGATLAFASELKAFSRLPDFAPIVNRDALARFIRYGVVTGPQSIFEGIFRLPPGHFLDISTLRLRSGLIPEPNPYWSLEDVARRGLEHQRLARWSDAEAEERLDAQLREAISVQMLADVPLGAFLSGGVDSSTVVALMQTQASRAIETFSIGFNESQYNEATHAKAVAAHLGTDHTEHYVSSDDARAVIPRLATIYCEPFADVSQIPTLLLCELAKRKVTVALSGDGGDELFGGYTRHSSGARVWQHVSNFPPMMRTLFANMISSVAPHSWDAVYNFLEPILPGRYQQRLPAEKLQKLVGILETGNESQLYERLVSVWHDPNIVPTSNHYQPGDRLARPSGASLSEYLMLLDSATYLPDDILVKMDRASMSVSLESRVPFLDHRVVELAWSIPLHQKIRHGHGKWILRQVLKRYVPAALTDRPKMGFAVPIGTWLRDPLRDWAESLLDVGRLTEGGLLDPAPIRAKWIEHISGRRNWQYLLWNVLMFQEWRSQWLGLR